MMRARVALFLLTLLLGTAALGRVGGGQSYSGGGSHGGGSYSGGGGGSYRSGGSYSGGGSGGTLNCGCSGFLLLIIFIFIVLAILNREMHRAATPVFQTAGADLSALHRFDPNFSQIVFEDFCNALYSKAHHARGTGGLERYAPFMSPDARNTLSKLNPPGLTEVRGIVVGALHVGELRGLEGPAVTVPVTFEANYTEVMGGSQESSWYVQEQWWFHRRRDILSPPPEKAKAEHCPRCGAPLQTRTDGSCQYCGVKIDDGTFQWYVGSIIQSGKDARGPLLTSDVPEEGTDLPTVRQPNLAHAEGEFAASHPGFDLQNLTIYVRDTALKLQDAWGSRDWEKVRPFETETLFQTHRYWIDAYLKQGLRNIVADYHVGPIEPVKIDSDAFYDGITFRVHASGRDYTVAGVNGGEKVVAGSKENVRSWSEYWTFIRTRGTQSDPSKVVSCPNCGASVEVGATGVCRHCGGKLVGGDFSWVLSRIEQDEAYTG